MINTGPIMKREFSLSLDGTAYKIIVDGNSILVNGQPFVIGFEDDQVLVDGELLLLRPGVVGGRPGRYAFSSEICGLDAAIPARDKTLDFQPMHLDTAIVGPQRQEVRICSQTDPLPLPH